MLACFSFWAASVAEVSAQAMETAAEYVHMIDYDTGTVLLSKRPDDPVTPASMAKLMTLEVVFDAIAERKVGLGDEFFVSENAWRTGGAPSRTATMFANVNSNVTLDNLLRGIMVQTANDACIAIAEGMAGSEEAFSVVMNERAREIGLSNSHFTNSTGLPQPEGQRTTMRDLVTLSQRLIREHPRLYAMFGEPEFTWNNIRQTNRNPIIAQGIGADGLMPGFAEDTGYGMVASATMDGQRIILAIHGLPSANARLAEVQKLFAWGFRAFERVRTICGRRNGRRGRGIRRGAGQGGVNERRADRGARPSWDAHEPSSAHRLHRPGEGAGG